jgi:putative hydrolase of the HAD superfamily
MLNHLNLKVVLFDLYGTLVDVRTDEHRPELWDMLARYLRYQGLSVEAKGLYSSFTDMADQAQHDTAEEYPETDVKKIFSKILGKLGCEAPGPLSTDVCKLFRTLSIVHTRLFDDTVPALEALRTGFQVGLVSDAQRVFLDSEIEMMGLAPLLDVVIASTDYGFHKPDRRLFDKALESLGVPPEKAIYVGDNVQRDICGANAANIPGVLLARDDTYIDEDSQCQPYRTVRSLSELSAWLVP